VFFSIEMPQAARTESTDIIKLLLECRDVTTAAGVDNPMFNDVTRRLLLG
jgi:hypothetical protein